MDQDSSLFSTFNAAFTIANIACIMVQRYNRARIYNTLEQKLELNPE